MKTSKIIFVSIAAGLAGVAVAELGSASVFASLAGDKLFAVGASLALIGFAVYDYSRRLLPVRPKQSNVLRPTVPASWRGAPSPGAKAIAHCAPVSERTAA